MKFKNIPHEEKPREKAIKYGWAKLTNAELLAIFLRTGNKDTSVLNLAQQLIEKIAGIGQLVNLTYQQIVDIKGIGKAKALALMASFELVKRIKLIQIHKAKIKITNPKDLYEVMEYEFEGINAEQFHIVLLNKNNEIINKKQIYQGTENQILIDLKDVFEFVLANKARKMICVHNHPSGNSTPSEEDLTTTKQIWDVATKLNVVLIDHIIFGKNEFYSISLNTKLKIPDYKQQQKKNCQTTQKK